MWRILVLFFLPRLAVDLASAQSPRAVRKHRQLAQASTRNTLCRLPFFYRFTSYDERAHSTQSSQAVCNDEIGNHYYNTMCHTASVAATTFHPSIKQSPVTRARREYGLWPSLPTRAPALRGFRFLSSGGARKPRFSFYRRWFVETEGVRIIVF